LRARRCDRSRPEWEATKGPMSVVEYVPADRASTSLVIEDPFSNLRGESFSHSRSRMRAASVSPADAEAPTALIAYAAARGLQRVPPPRLARPRERRTSPGRVIRVRRHSPRKQLVVRHPCAPRRGPTRDRHRWRRAVGCRAAAPRRKGAGRVRRIGRPTPPAADDARRSAFRRGAR
jgi:hypothetical protein